MTPSRSSRSAVLSSIIMTLAACGGGSSPPAAPRYSVGGTATGLGAAGLVLQNNGGDDLPVPSNGPFTFSSTLSDGAAYSVAVKVHPASHLCSVSNAAGIIAGADVTDVVATCAADRMLVASDGTADAYFGQATAASSDGSVIVVGADGAATRAGAAYVYRWSGAAWVEARLAVADAAQYDGFGSSVAVSGDGSLVVVGAQGDTVGANAGQGSLRVYRWSGTAYTAEATLTAGDGAAGDALGFSVAVTPDGSTIVAGAPWDDGASTINQGSVYVFRWNGSAHQEVKKLVASDGGTYSDFGYSVAVSADGNAVLAGAPYHDVGSNGGQGAAYLYTWDGSAWAERQLTASDGTGSEFFGWSVAMAGDAGTVAIGVPDDWTGTVLGHGSVYLLRHTGSAWAETRLRPADYAENDHFGYSVSLSANASRLVVGAYRGGGAPLERGAVYVYDAVGAAWSVARLLAPDGLAQDQLGTSVAVSSDGSTVVGGARLDDVGANANQGSVHVYR